MKRTLVWGFCFLFAIAGLFAQQISQTEVAKNLSRLINSGINDLRAEGAQVKLGSVKALTASDVTKKGPLLGAVAWGQGNPFNGQCPKDSVGNQSVTGCGATAMTQVMKMYEWPLQGVGSKKNDKAGTINFAQATYDWTNILPVYTSAATQIQKDAVAQLMLHAGVASDMNYSSDGSGTSIEAVASALKNHFRYSDKMQRVYRFAYTDEEWFNLIKREIDLGRPVIYSGSRSTESGGTAGHLFVCDGYSTDGKLHFNFGWDGGSNDFIELEKLTYSLENTILTGIFPNTTTIPDESLPTPMVAMVTPLNLSSYQVKTGTKFNAGVKVANYNMTAYKGKFGVALYNEDGSMRGEPLATTTEKNLQPSSPAVTADENLIKKMDIMIKDIAIPKATPSGKYLLRLIVSQGNSWFPVQGVLDYVVKDLNVSVKNGEAAFSYPLSTKVCEIELAAPIEVSVASNRATVKFTIQNKEDESDVDSSAVYVMANTDDNLVPSVWKEVKIDQLLSGATKTIEVSDIPVPTGTSGNCRFYVAYNRAMVLPNKRFPNKSHERIASTPLMPAGYNFKNYQVQEESESFSIYFDKKDGKEPVTIPSDYKTYLDGQESEKKVWKGVPGITGYASPPSVDARLVTNRLININENSVLEWSWKCMNTVDLDYTVSVSTEGQEYTNFNIPFFKGTFPNEGIARVSLAEFAGQDVYISFSCDSKRNQYGLQYFKMLEIRSPKDISVESINIPGSAKVEQEVPVKVAVKNHSAINVKKVTASYTYAGKTVAEEIETNIAFNETKELAFKTPIQITGTSGDVQPIKVEIQLEGEEVAQQGNNSRETKIMVVNFFPKKNLLAFKASKLQCGGCAMAYAKLVELEQNYPSVVIPMELWRDGTFDTADKGYEGYTAGTTPAYFMDGAHTIDADYMSNTISATYSNMSAPATVEVEADYESETSRKLKIRVQSTFALPLTGTYRLGAVILENNVVDVDRQVYGSAPKGKLLTKDHIVVGVVGGTNGASGYSISDPKAQEYVYECEYTIPEENTAANRYCKDDIQVVGVLYDENGKIINAGLNSYYLKFPKTAGLTFTALDNAPAFKHIYEIEHIPKTYDLKSIETYRATLPTDSTFRFKVEKDSTFAGKTVKLVVNKEDRLRGVTAEKEILIPDYNGIYTISKADKHYFITFEIENESVAEALVSKSDDGSVWTLSGAWKADDFTNVLGEVEEKVTSLDMTGIVIPENPAQLNLKNPNTLIYLSEGSVIPENWKNVVRGNVAPTIVLEEGKLFHALKAFTATFASFKEKAGTNTISLPFVVSELPEGVTIQRIDSISNDTLSFVLTKELLANTPYLITVAGSDSVTLTAANVQISETGISTDTPAAGYSFRKTYNTITTLADRKLYALNSEGNKFERITETPNICAFRGYMEYVGTAAEPYEALKVGYLSKAIIKPETTDSSSLVLEGVWNKEDFEEQLAQIEEKVTEVDMSKVELPEGLGDLKVDNSNTLIYVSENAQIPAGWEKHNIVRGNRAETVHLEGGKPFRATTEIEAETVVFEALYKKGWTTICLPYDLNILPANVKAEELTGYENGKLVFKEVENLTANTPYLISVEDDAVKKTFSSSGKIHKTDGNNSLPVNEDYAFKYTYSNLTPAEVAGRTLFVVNADGNGFIPLPPATRAAGVPEGVAAFQAYVEYVGEGEASAGLVVEHREGTDTPDPTPDPEPDPTPDPAPDPTPEPEPDPTPDPDLPTGIDKVISPETLDMYVKGNELTLVAGRNRTVYIFDMGGKLRKIAKLTVGTNKIYGLEKGLYIIEKQKIIIK